MKQRVIDEKCGKCGKRIGFISVSSSFILCCFKLFMGIASGSHALMANAFYSLQDVLSAGIVAFSVKYSRKKTDEEHPYGYGKIEFISTVILSSGIIIGVLVIFFFAGKNVLMGPKRPSILAFWAAVVSMFATYILSRYVMCAGNTLNSPAIISNSKHIRADYISSICVVVGIGITKLGFSHLDSLIAIFEAIHITATSVEILIVGFKGLMDASLPDREVEKIKEIAKNVEGVNGISCLRTHQIGQRSEVDIEIQIAPRSGIKEANLIASKVKSALVEQIPKIGKVNVCLAPARSDLLEEKDKTLKIIKVLQDYYRVAINQHRLKIMKGQISLLLDFFPKTPLPARERICSRIKEKIKNEIAGSDVHVEVHVEVKEEGKK